MPVPERLKAVEPMEDHLFRSGVVGVKVDVTPEWRTSPLGDLVLRGFIAGKEIEVVFPGSRRSDARDLIQRLQRSADHINAQLKAKQKPAAGELRQRLNVDGVWRVRLMAEQHGMPIRRFQLVAARWRFQGADGKAHMGGSVPYG